MSLGADYRGNKGFRLLNMYERLSKGEAIAKTQLANDFGVTQKTIQRDIDDLRAYLADTHITDNEVTIKYDKGRNVYYLVRLEREWLTNEEVMALCKILLESRAFCKVELNIMIDKLLSQVVPNDRKKIDSMIRSEQHHYVPLRHGKHLLGILWELSLFITNNEVVQFEYTRQDGASRSRSVKPVALMFSEYYFYLIAYLADDSKDFPIIFRVDRIADLKGTNQHFSIPYRERFNDGEFRKRVQFMYAGELKRITFEFSGPSLEAVLDRLPTAEVVAKKEGVVTIKTEVYGAGIEMWLRSQGEYIKVLERR